MAAGHAADGARLELLTRRRRALLFFASIFKRVLGRLLLSHLRNVGSLETGDF